MKQYHWLQFGFVFACLLVGSSPASQAEDLIVLKTLDEIEGKVLRAEKNKVYVQVEFRGGKAESAYNLDQIEKIIFETVFNRTTLPTDPKARLVALDSLWKFWQSFLPVPESPAGEILFARAETLADLQQFEEALKAAELLETEDWNQKRRLLIAPLKVKCLAGLNRFEEAMLMAKQMEEQSKDSSIVAFVQLVLGEVEFGRTNYPAALDHFLYNRVFNPTLKEEAGRGLWNASRVYLAETNFSAAVRVLQDIITDYPQSSVFARAQTKLKELQPLVKTETNEEKEENEPNQEQETTTQ